MADIIKIADALSKGVDASVSRWPTFSGKELDRSKYVTASEIGTCARKIKFGKMATPNDRTESGNLKRWGFAERGNSAETWIVEKLEAAGVGLEYAGRDQRSFYVGAQAGTPDGMYPYQNGKWLVEFKSIDPRKRRSDLPSKAHVDQVHQNMDVVSFCLDVPVYGGSLFYINASDYQDTLQFDIHADHAEQQRLQDRAEWIIAAASPADLPNEGMFNGDCDYCGFTDQCSRIVAGDYADLQNTGKGIFK